jgi:hypothetical protein
VRKAGKVGTLFGEEEETFLFLEKVKNKRL